MMERTEAPFLTACLSEPGAHGMDGTLPRGRGRALSGAGFSSYREPAVLIGLGRSVTPLMINQPPQRPRSLIILIARSEVCQLSTANPALLVLAPPGMSALLRRGQLKLPK